MSLSINSSLFKDSLYLCPTFKRHRFIYLFLLQLGLYEFAKNKTIVSGLAFSSDGKRFATLSTDRKVYSHIIYTVSFVIPF